MSKLELGAFSMSLAVRDLNASSEFYQKLGFEVTHEGQGYLIIVNGTTVIGLFQGMFEGNILTFNPGLCAKNDSEGALLEAWRVDEFTDIRAIQKHLKSLDLEFVSEVDEKKNPNGPGSLMLQDPDGNVILVDQFFDCPDASV
ncbi:MAG: VOC family protein [Bacteroidota bacterium]|nr:VOC family protein [Bacteroidota bacterium]MDE2646061.1 VOC family protein [Bacteroidota bacterium]MXW13794.1 VOC family protein [Rhodothermaceae bacterium]MYC03372.1 VOC family protein [Rhodothermaceae bacterium]MYI16290.1 VOC family protein [Rhodothermaceae bacterium]